MRRDKLFYINSWIEEDGKDLNKSKMKKIMV
jgi:hypothetical protein